MKKNKCGIHKDIWDNTNIISDIDSITATHNCVNNSITDMASSVIKFCFSKSNSRSQDYDITWGPEFSDILSV